MNSKEILSQFEKEVKAGNFRTMEDISPGKDFYVSVNDKGELFGADDSIDPEKPRTWGFVIYKRGFCQSTDPPGAPFMKKVDDHLQISMAGKFLVYNPFAKKNKINSETVGACLAPGAYLVRIGTDEN